MHGLLYSRMHADTHIHTRTHADTHIHTSTHARTKTYTHTHTHARTHARTHTHTHTHTHTQSFNEGINKYLFFHTSGSITILQEGNNKPQAEISEAFVNLKPGNKIPYVLCSV